MYIRAGRFQKAITLLEKCGKTEKLFEVMWQLDKGDLDLLHLCAQVFKNNGKVQYARETLKKMEDTAGLVQVSRHFNLEERSPGTST